MRRFVVNKKRLSLVLLILVIIAAFSVCLTACDQRSYEFYYSASPHGTVVGYVHQTVKAGETGTTVAAVADLGYGFVGWSDGVESASRTDIAEKNLYVTAEFVRTTRIYYLNYSSVNGGQVTGQLIQTVQFGENGSTVTAVPDEGYVFTGWSDGVETAERTDLNVSGNIEVTANFSKAVYKLVYQAWNNGSVVGKLYQTVTGGGSGTVVKAIPDEGYVFTGWSDGVETAERTDINVNKNIEVTAFFSKKPIKTHNLQYIPTEHGIVCGIPYQNVAEGENGSMVIAVPDEGYVFAGWSDGVTTVARTDKNVRESIKVYAQFKRKADYYTLLYVSTRNGTIAGESRQSVMPGMNGSMVTAVPNEGYEFIGWSDGVATAERTDINVKSDIFVVAEFREIAPATAYTLIYNSSDGGFISGNDIQSVVDGGSGSTVTAVPNDGYEFIGWSDGVTTAERTDIEMHANLTVRAEFSKIVIYFTLQYIASENGSIWGETEQIVAENSDGAEVRAVPCEDYEFVKWSDGVTTAERTDTNIQSDLCVTAEFRRKQCEVKLIYTDEDTETLTVASNDIMVLPNLTRMGYYFRGWTDGDCAYNGGDTVRIKEDITLTASWNIRTFNITYVLNDGTLETTLNSFTVEDLPITSLPIPQSTVDNKYFAMWSTDSAGKYPIERIEKQQSNLKHFTLYANYTDTSNFLSYVFDEGLGGYSVSGFNGNAKKVIIPSEYEGYPVKSIGQSAFHSCNNLTTVVMPDCLTIIDNNAFYGCYNLTDLVLPADLTTIGDSAFFTCTTLDRIIIPDKVENIGANAFGNCYDLMSVDLPQGLVSLGDYAFKNCWGLIDVTIPGSVTKLGRMVFMSCDNLLNAEISYGVKTISVGLFVNCKNLTSVIIPESVVSIEVGAFARCPNLTSIAIPNSVTSIASNVCTGSTSLQTVYVASAEVANSTLTNLYMYATDVYILDGIEVTNALFAEKFEKEIDTVEINGKIYQHYVKIQTA